MAVSNQIRVIAQNYANVSTLTALPDVSNIESMPVTNLQNANRTRSFRTTAIDEDGFVIEGELPTRVRVSACVLYAHNMKVGDLWRIRLWSGPGQTGDLIETEWLDVLVPKTAGELDWAIDTLTSTVFDDWPGKPFSAAWFGSVAVQSYAIEIVSDGNPDGYAEINQLIFGPASSPNRNFSYGYALDYFQTSAFELTEGGSTRVEPGVYGRVITLTLPRLTDIERSAWADFLRYIRQYSQVFISLFPERGGKLERDYSMVCMVKSSSPLQNVNAKKFTLNLTFQEI